MREASEDADLRAALQLLRADREALPWAERRALAASLEGALARGSVVALALVNLLVEDTKPEVRKEIADLLFLLPEAEFTRLAGQLAGDSSSFVQRAVARALDRRRKGQKEVQRRRVRMDHVEADYASIEKYHGTLAASRARKLADKQFDLLVGTMVHDIRGILNPLKSGISTLLENVKAKSINPKVFEDGLGRMGERVAFLERFVDDMRAYSHATPAERRRERISEVVGQATTVVLEDLKAKGFDVTSVSLTVEVPENITAEIARHQIVAALAHVLKNAYEALGDTAKGGRHASIRAQMDEENVQIVIADNGPGIAAEDLESIRDFIPGRTTKKNRGTGFGLPTAHKYTVQHGGSLVIESEEGKGTSVTFRVPLEGEEADEAQSARR